MNTELQPRHLTSQLEMKLCIDRSIEQSPQSIKKYLQNQCAQVMKRHQLDLSYSNGDFGDDMLALFNKINEYGQVVQHLLCDFVSCRKLGHLLAVINECFKNVFTFLQTHLNRKKNYTEQKLKLLQQKFESQAPGNCNRCRKFILSRDIEETKVLISAGQFNDPYNLFDAGSCDFVNSRNKEEDEQYRVKFADVWQNKKKIEEKFNLMQIQYDRRSYGCTYSVGQIQKIEDVIKGIVDQISKHDAQGPQPVPETFQIQITQLINNIYKKARLFKNFQNLKDQGVQVGQLQKAQILEQLKGLNEKNKKKNNQLNRKIVMREKQLTDIRHKLAKVEEDLGKCFLEKNSIESSMKTLLSKQIQNQNQLFTANSEVKMNLKRVMDLQKQNETLKNEIRKIYSHMENRNQIKNKIMTNRSRKDINEASSKKDLHCRESQHEKQVEGAQESAYERELQRESKRISFLVQSIKKSISDESVSKDRQKEGQKEKQRSDEVSGEEESLQVSRKNVKKLTQIREQSSISISRIHQDAINEDIQKSQISIEIRKTEKNLQYFKTASSKKIKNMTKSLRKIKRKSSIKRKQQEESNSAKFNKVDVGIQVDAHHKSKSSPRLNNSLSNTKRKISKLKQSRVYFNSQIKNKERSSLQNKKIKSKPSQIDSQGKPQQQLPNKTNKLSYKFNSMHQSKELKPQSQSMYQLQNKQPPFESRKTSIKKQSIQRNVENLKKTTNYASHYRGSNIRSELLDNQVGSSFSSNLPNIYNAGKMEQLKIGNQSKIIQAFTELYRLYDAIVDEKIQKYELFQKLSFEKFQTEVQDFIRRCASLNDSQPKTTIPEGLLHPSPLEQSSVNMMKINKYQSMYSTASAFKQTTQNIRQRKQKFNDQQLQNNHNSTLNQWNINKIFQFQKKLKKKETQVSPIQIKEIKQKIGKIFLSSEEAYQLQKSHSSTIPSNLAGLNTSFGNFRNNKNLPLPYAQEITKYLSKPQIKYIKVITILLAKLHDRNITIYQVVKKSLIFPYSYLGDGLVMPSVQLQRESLGRRTIGGSEFSRKDNSLHVANDTMLLSQALVKLVILHRKCEISKQKLSKESREKLQKRKNEEDCRCPYENRLCKHLLQFQIQISKQFLELCEQFKEDEENRESQQGNLTLQA